MNTHDNFENCVKDQLTIILSIRDNHEMTTRWLEYAMKVRLRFKIIIADGSNRSFILAKKHENTLRVKLVRSEYDKDHITYMRKLSHILNKVVDTEFCLLADNDDFYIFSEIERYVKFLIENRGYAACCGSIIKFELSQIYFGTPRFTHLAKLSSFKQKEPIKRLSAILDRANYREIYYDVMYTKTLRTALSDFIRLNNNDVNYRFLEFYIAVKVLSTGKAKSFNEVFLLRQEDYQSSTSKDLGLLDSIFLKNWSHLYHNLIKYANTSFINDHGEFNNEKLINQSFRTLFETHLSDKIISGGVRRISFISFLRSRYKKTFYFTLIKSLRSYVRIKRFYVSESDLVKKLKKIVFD